MHKGMISNLTCSMISLLVRWLRFRRHRNAFRRITGFHVWR